MKAIILAAGRGERMKPLTDFCPKPMLKVAGKPLIEHHIDKLVRAGINDIVINLAWLGQHISSYIGDGSRWGITIRYSDEGQQALETAGGIRTALTLFSKLNSQEPILVVNGDVFSSFDYCLLPQLAKEQQAFLWLVDNPSHNPKGDFALRNGVVNALSSNDESCNFTYSGLGVYKAVFFARLTIGKTYALGPILREKLISGAIGGDKLLGTWTDVGTPERLEQLNAQLKNKVVSK